MLLCLVPAAGYLGLALAAGYGIDALWPSGEDGGHWPGWHAFWPPLLMIVLLVPFQAAAEEYVFRGWLLQSIGSFTGEGRALGRIFGSPWPAIIVSSVPFVAGHAYTDWGILDIGAFAVIAAWVTVRTGGLEAAIALHVVNNMTGMILSASEGDLAIDQGAVPLPEVVVDVAAMLVWALAVVWMFGHTGSKRPMKRLS
jgi:membrane protease YdiL (CAAX protease family)